jgi:uncharacterized protein (DUF2237 family)
MDESVNVFDEPLEPCGTDPVTGFFRDGCCNTNEDDHGCHTVCVAVTDEFLSYTRSQGNDLSTPVPAFGFRGLNREILGVCAPHAGLRRMMRVKLRVFFFGAHIKRR